MKLFSAGIDVGGTKTQLCLTDEQGNILEEHKLETQLSRDPGKFFNWLFDELEQSCIRNGGTLSSLKGVGIGFPGVMNERTGTLTSAPALNWPAVDIRPLITARYPGTVVLDNDVNMAALGEHAAGAAAGSGHFIMITVGTGVGSALFLDGRLYRGAGFAAGEIGYLIVKPGEYSAAADPEYSEFGPFEMEASGTGIGAKAADYLHSGGRPSLIRELAQGGPVRAEHVFAAARREDKAALQLLDQAYGHMAAVIKNIVLTLDLELVILGGGVVEKNPGYIDEIVKRVSCYPPHQPPAIRQAVLGNRAGAIGAAAAVRSRITSGN
ncbi:MULTISPECIES: ROK family protein [unclassified Paenibacillus]|uniref:ROK family protein n=1 Tax=unclassified Paenibacillus TaxID=185978 RepID=UPI00240763E2|nr:MULTISPECIES: ROK family protein [unclassified Paenibacillus]MDF9841854.1 glucokinase [Paenibacillus sp. PastF-2]MDF9848465.1 glucokinase [Paenibacillus sp. PastM-2]MDF9855014.1 glucokinase [Paenibacillus sp. PastF-1]MDH6480283.1 glucokinase [Paenibacillus sp. PastH-2]MDH6507733.1 glucokinase [Paenibacillus sp. PastM-3]